MGRGRLVAEKGTPGPDGAKSAGECTWVDSALRPRRRSWPQRRPRSPTWRRRGRVVGRVAVRTVGKGHRPARPDLRSMVTRSLVVLSGRSPVARAMGPEAPTLTVARSRSRGATRRPGSVHQGLAWRAWPCRPRPVLWFRCCDPNTRSQRHRTRGASSSTTWRVGNGSGRRLFTTSLLIRFRLLAPATSEGNQARTTRDRASAEPTTRS